VKEIDLPIQRVFSMPLKVSFGGPSGDKMSINCSEGRAELSIAANNSGKIIYATSSIENMIEKFIINYLFGTVIGGNMSRQRSFFSNYIIQASSFQFSFKKSLFIQAVKDESLITRDKISEIERLLKRVMDCRNAFAHGDFVYHSDGNVRNSYFLNGSKTDVLNDDYWSKLELDFRSAHSLVDEACKNLGKMMVRPEENGRSRDYFPQK